MLLRPMARLHHGAVHEDPLEQVLLTGCVAAKGTSSLVLRVFDGKMISEPRMLPWSRSP